MKDQKKKNEKEEKGLAVVENEDGEQEEGSTEEDHAEIRQEILRLRTKMENDYWELGIALDAAYRDDLYRSWGFESWKQYVEEEVDIGLRRAQYLVKLQGWFEQMTPAIQEWMRGLGWTKARKLMHVVTQENAMEWKARVANKTVAQIEAIVDANKNTGEGGGGGGSEPGDGNGEEKPVKVSMSLFPRQKELYDMALEKAGSIAQSEKPGHIITSIIQEWLATNTTLITIDDYLKNAERYTGMKLIALVYNEEKGKHDVAWGEENIDTILSEGSDDDAGDDDAGDEDVDDVG